MTSQVSLLPGKHIQLGAGTHTDIVEIVAPDSAAQGERVDVTVKVKNIDTYWDHVIACVAIVDGLRFIDEAVIIRSGETYPYSGAFLMAGGDVTIYAYTYYPRDTEWILDDTAQVDIKLEEVIGWQLLDTASVAIKSIIPGWQLLDTRLAGVGTILPGWQLLDSRSVAVKFVPPVVGWQLLDSRAVAVKSAPPPVVGWQPLDEKTVGLTAGPPEEIPPEYILIQETIHPAAYVWEGEAEVCVIEFPLGPEQLPFTQWGGLKLAETFANAIEAEGNSILELKVWEDTTPLLWTNYRFEIKAAVASEEQGVAVWPWLVAIGAVLASLPWKAIILGALTVLGIWVVGWVIEKLIKTVDRVIHKPLALTDEVIDALGREDLIPMILYKAPRVEYEVSPEVLEGMTDDGLRALLKELRDRQGPPPIDWWPLALVGGLGVLGVGAAVAMAAKRK